MDKMINMTKHQLNDEQRQEDAEIQNQDMHMWRPSTREKNQSIFKLNVSCKTRFKGSQALFVGKANKRWGHNY